MLKHKQLEACFSGPRVTDHMRGHYGLGGCQFGRSPTLRRDQPSPAHELLTVRTPKGITLSSKVEVFTDTMISPQMQLLLQLIKRTIKTKAISQVHRPQSSSQLSDAALLPKG